MIKCIEAIVAIYLLSGCAAAPMVAGYFTSGGVSLYKSEKSSGPKAEFVLFKVEVNHIVYENK
jgi:hypothetical protein